MSWERRGNQIYYYNAKRVGRKVIKQFVPQLVAPFAALVDADRSAMRAEAMAERKRFRDELDALDAALAPLNSLANDIITAAMLAAGYYRHHRGPWRKRRVPAESVQS